MNLNQLLPYFILLALTCSAAGGEETAGNVDISAVTWSLDDASGATVSFPHEHEGPVILLFWASWCPFCKALMPHLQSIVDEYPDGELTIYAINFRDDGDPAGYMQSQGFDFTLLLNGGDVAKAYGMHATPGLLIFDSGNRPVMNLYDVMERYNAEFTLSDDLSFKQKAARKAPWWAARIREALDSAH